MEPLIPADEAARRLRAAIGYSSMNAQEVAEAIGIPPDTFRGFTGRKNPKSATLDLLYRVADACGVPRAFMQDGFGASSPVAKPAAPIPDERPKLPSQRPTRSGTRAPRSRRAAS